MAVVANSGAKKMFKLAKSALAIQKNALAASKLVPAVVNTAAVRSYSDHQVNIKSSI